MSIVGTVTVAVGLINGVATAARTVMGLINDIKKNINTIRTTEMDRVWKSAKNTDSQAFNTKMEELERDIQKAYDILNEYEQLLQRSAKEYENRQQEVHAQASNLKSPTNR